MSQTPSEPRRQWLRQWGQYCLCGALACAGARQAVAQPSPPPATDDWKEVQPVIRRAHGMASRVTTTMDGLSSMVARLLTSKERLHKEVNDLVTEIERLKKERDELLEEYRNGLFCSGCGQTKSQILRKGEQFPHSGQSIIRPTAAQIQAKEQQLQAPIDRAEATLVKKKKELEETSFKVDAGLIQLAAGVQLWQTSITFWNAAVNRGLRERKAQLDAQLLEFQKALGEEIKRQETLPEDQRKDRDAEVRAWRRLLEEQQRQSAEFSNDAQKVSSELAQQRREQQRKLNTYLARPPLDKTLLINSAVDLVVSRVFPAEVLGLRYLMGQLPPYTGLSTNFYPTSYLPDVQTFVQDFRNANWVLEAPASTGNTGATAGPSAGSGASVSPKPAQPPVNRLLQALP